MKSVTSVVVVTFNRPNDVEETVASLLNQTVKPLEIIVIDNGSTPPASIKYRSEILIVQRLDKEAGLSNARNYGIKIAKGECVAFTDDDAVAEKNWVGEIQRGLENASVDGGTIKPLYQAKPPEWWNENDFGGFVGVGNVRASSEIWGGNMAFRTEVFKTIGLFNPKLGRRKGTLLSFEESEFIERARRRGFGAHFIETAVVYHKVSAKRMTLGYLFRRGYYEGRSSRVVDGFQPLAAVFSLLICVISMANPRVIIVGKTCRVRKIIFLAMNLGKIF